MDRAQQNRLLHLLVATSVAGVVLSLLLLSARRAIITITISSINGSNSSSNSPRYLGPAGGRWERLEADPDAGLAILLQESIDKEDEEGGNAETVLLAQAFSSVSNDSISRHLKRITVQPHIAGTTEDFATAAYVQARFEAYGLEAHHLDFPVLLSYPLNISVSMFLPKGRGSSTKGEHTRSIKGEHTRSIKAESPRGEESTGEGEEKEEEEGEEEVRQLSLREAAYPDDDPYTTNPLVTTPFLAYSADGDVRARLVYANYGRTSDFALLKKMGVGCCEGLIVIMRYGQIYRGDKVQNAAQNGAIGALIFSDPADYARNGTAPDATYPHARSLPPSGAQRGSIYASLGDPQTPGWPSRKGGERIPVEELQRKGALPSIPAAPISYANAEILLREMGGPLVPEGWAGAIPGLKYRVGPGPVQVRLNVKMNLTVATIRNVIGIVRGYKEPNRYVILGNHRDAWVYGAADPNSGTACLVEVARVLGGLHSSFGWRPRRSIVLGSWDAEEFALIGSTEWVEANLGLLKSGAVAYLNADTAVSGSGFYAASTPQLDQLLREVTSQVPDPDGPPGETVYGSWAARQNRSDPQLERLGGGGSDFAAFLQHAGVASSDHFFGGDYPAYHSMYDDFVWMERFGDPGFKRHVASTRVWLGLAVRLSSDAVIPFNYSLYVTELAKYVDELEDALSRLDAPPGSVSLAPLHAAVDDLTAAAAATDKLAKALKAQTNAGRPSGGIRAATGGRRRRGLYGPDMPTAVHRMEQDVTGQEQQQQRKRQRQQQQQQQRQALNDRLILAERAFLNDAGIARNLSWYKHMIYGPAGDDDYSTLALPAIQEALSCSTAHAIQHGKESFTQTASTSGSSSSQLNNSSQHGLSREPGRGREEDAVVRNRAALASLDQFTPGSDAAGADCWRGVQHEVFRTARTISRVAAVLRGELA